MMRRLDQFTRVRTRNAAALLEGVTAIRGLKVLRSLPNASAAHLRFPILCVDAVARSRTLQQMRGAGIGASESYPSALVDVPELRPHLVPGATAAGARQVAHRILTLPTHPFVTRRDIARTISTLRTIEGLSPHAGREAATPV
jgi:dTDP-4-amino-4,6-dideoxygalactose transaminase